MAYFGVAATHPAKKRQRPFHGLLRRNAGRSASKRLLKAVPSLEGDIVRSVRANVGRCLDQPSLQRTEPSLGHSLPLLYPVGLGEMIVAPTEAKSSSISRAAASRPPARSSPMPRHANRRIQPLVADSEAERRRALVDEENVTRGGPFRVTVHHSGQRNTAARGTRMVVGFKSRLLNRTAGLSLLASAVNLAPGTAQAVPSIPATPTPDVWRSGRTPWACSDDADGPCRSHRLSLAQPAVSRSAFGVMSARVLRINAPDSRHDRARDDILRAWRRIDRQA
jgi:hypothetical protein